MKEALIIENLSKSYMTQGESNSVLNNLNLTVYENEFICILGPSGCGKSTLLRCIAGFEEYNGTVICNGKKVVAPSTERIMVFQDYNQLFPWKTVEKNIRYPLKVNGMKDKDELKRISDSYLKKVGLDGYGGYYPHELSGGMKQRVVIAISLACTPKGLIADEPATALDSKAEAEMYTLLRQVNSEGIAVVMISHDMESVLSDASHILLLGRSVWFGTRSDYLQEAGKDDFR